jgi:hypothetical protein
MAQREVTIEMEVFLPARVEMVVLVDYDEDAEIIEEWEIDSLIYTGDPRQSESEMEELIQLDGGMLDTFYSQVEEELKSI